MRRLIFPHRQLLNSYLRGGSEGLIAGVKLGSDSASEVSALGPCICMKCEWRWEIGTTADPAHKRMRAAANVSCRAFMLYFILEMCIALNLLIYLPKLLYPGSNSSIDGSDIENDFTGGMGP